MWYTTDFSWQLIFSKPLSEAQITLFEQISWERGNTVQSKRGGKAPDSYCAREITKDGTWLERDGSEKFYYYEEWLNYIETQVLRKRGIIMEGGLQFQWEEIWDTWVIKRNKDGQREAMQIEAIGLVCCPECWHRFMAEEWEVDEDEE